jgi:hypothetical protein
MTEPGANVMALYRNGGKGSIGEGYSSLKRRTEEGNKSKSAFHFKVPGQVACSTHAGIPWLNWLRGELGGQVHFWPFDGWTPRKGQSVVVEVYPSLWAEHRPAEGTLDEKDAYAVAKKLALMDRESTLDSALNPDLNPTTRTTAAYEGWILGVSAKKVSQPVD